MPVQSSTKLLFASWATVMLIGLMFIVFFRRKKKEYAWAVLPLGIPAGIYILSGILARLADPILSFANSYQIRIIIDLAAALVACLLIGILSGKIPGGKRNRTIFAICATAFVVVFSGLLIMNSLRQAVGVS